MLSRLGASGHVARGHMGRMRSPSSRWSLAVLGLPWPGDTPCSTSNVPFPAAWAGSMGSGQPSSCDHISVLAVITSAQALFLSETLNTRWT